ncbi:hypothetical protein FQA47_017736 [Oryzias melastigma]|uniref:Uncharacterized protein n=1 Tax=Oryzias melastigma TaxID=30732 RepID=A0A834CC62_ORYME|nr:hypothetical protein FQA47_017736 [Oryzias melastigma]
MLAKVFLSVALQRMFWSGKLTAPKPKVKKDQNPLKFFKHQKRWSGERKRTDRQRLRVQSGSVQVLQDCSRVRVQSGSNVAPASRRGSSDTLDSHLTKCLLFSQFKFVPKADLWTSTFSGPRRTAGALWTPT